MEYKGYAVAPISFASEAGVFSGVKAVLHFEATTTAELVQAFRDIVEDYVECCAERGQEPERPFKGHIMIGTAPELHRKAALRAAAEGMSLNEWISRRIAEAA